MTRREYFAFLAVVFLAAIGLSGSSAQQSVDDTAGNSVSIEQLEAFTDGIVADRMDDLDPAAMMVTVVRGDEGFAKAYGLADAEKGREADETTLFRIGSISKTFVWLSVMLLVEEGKIDLDDDVNDYLKTFKVPEAFDKPVTMNDLMTHRAGFEDSLQMFVDPRRDTGLAESLKRSIPKRVSAPGERTVYSNWGSTLAALIVQNVAGEPYDAFAKRRIIDPLGMNSTTFRDPASIVKNPLNPAPLDARMAHPHKPKDGSLKKLRYMSVEPEYPIGAMALDARDAAKYMRMLINGTRYDGGQLLSDESWTKFRSRIFTDRVGANDINHGFMEFEIGGEQAFGHGGTTQFSSMMTVIPGSEIGIFISSSSPESSARPNALIRMIALYAQGKSLDISAFLKKGDKKLSEELAGTYMSNRRSFSMAEKIFALGGDMEISVAEDGAAITTSGSGKVYRFAPVGEDLWMTANGYTMKAYRDDNGKIFRISGGAGTQTLDRVGFMQSSNAVFIAVGIALLLSVTTFLGAWWRWGQKVSSGELGQKLRSIPIAVAVIWLLLGAGLIWLTIALSDIGLEEMQDGQYPPTALRILLWLTILAAIAALVQIVAVIPVWLKSGWTIWRRVHFTIYAAALAFAVIVMWNWNLIGKPLYDLG